MNRFIVTIPIGGHAIVEVEAESEEEAESKAFDALTRDHIEEWDALRKVNSGNVCHFPQPWQIEIEDEGPVE